MSADREESDFKVHFSGRTIGLLVGDCASEQRIINAERLSSAMPDRAREASR